MLKKIRPVIAASIIAVSGISAQDAAKTSLPTTVVNDREYYYYDVQPHETIFSLSSRLGMTREEIISFNPAVADGLKAYTRLYFPVESGHDSILPQAKDPAEIAEVTHTVQKGETLYGIAKKHGVTVDRLIRLNPSTRDGVNIGQTLVISLREDAPAKPAVNLDTPTRKYVIGEKETLYSIASRSGITVEQLLQLNPSLDAFNYAAGTEIAVPDIKAVTTVTEAKNDPVGGMTEDIIDDAPGANTLLIPGQNIPLPSDRQASVSDRVLVSNAAPEANLPETPESTKVAVDKIESDHTLVIPGQNAELPLNPPQSVVVPALPDGETADKAKNDDKAPLQLKESYEIAVLLPFMLSAENPPKGAELFTDFYRGFLLAADTLSHKGAKVNIRAYDVAASLDSIDAILSRPEIANVDLFIGPDNDKMFNRLVEKVDPDRAFIVNSFAVKNDSYKENANVIQTNIPQAEMYAKAIEAFMNENAGRQVVFVSRLRGDADKTPFVDQLKARLNDSGKGFKEISYASVLEDENLADLPTEVSYVFVPVSSSRTEFLKLVPALKRFKLSLVAQSENLSVFGYPEWLTFRGDALDGLQDLDATVYSRFFYNPDDYRTNRVAEKFRSVYGKDMMEGVPSQAMLGYDTGMFAIEALRANGGDFHALPYRYDGLQSDFFLNDADCEGLVDDSLLLIHFRQNGLTESRNI